MRDHATYISDQIREYIYKKYQAGQEAHGGNLERKELLSHAIEEAADLCVYLFTKRDQESDLVMRLDALEAHIKDIGRLTNSKEHALRITQNIRNILTIGNPEGIEEEEHESR